MLVEPNAFSIALDTVFSNSTQIIALKLYTLLSYNVILKPNNYDF